MTDLEAAISRLEQAAAVWFNQDLHRDLQALIAAARANTIQSSRPATYSVVESSQYDMFNQQIPRRAMPGWAAWRGSFIP